MAKVWLPLVLFLALLALLGVGLGLNPREVPSPLIDRPAPAFRLPQLEAPEAEISETVFRQAPVTLVNVWASWCAACREEHDLLMALSRSGVAPIVGLNYKDGRSEALAWLERHGNPYTVSAFDARGATGLDWGVYGVPETFVVDGRGVIRYKHIGPLTERAVQETLLPLIDRIRREA